MIRRPKPGETEEDLLRQQQQFLASRQPASATVVRRPDKRKSAVPDSGEAEAKTFKVQKDVVQLAGASSMASTMFHSSGGPMRKRTSKFKEQQSAGRVTFDLDEDEDDPEQAMEKRDTHITSVLSKIMERDAAPTSRFLPRTTNQGFPSVLHRGADLKQQPASQEATKTKKKQSLFAQQFDGTSPASFGLSIISHPSAPSSSPSGPAASSPSPVLDETPRGCSDETMAASMETSGLASQPCSSQDWSEIHQENLARLSRMSEADILEEQKKLQNMLDPSLVTFIQSRHKSISDAASSATSAPPKTNITSEEVAEAMEAECTAEDSENTSQDDPTAATTLTGVQPAPGTGESERMDASSQDSGVQVSSGAVQGSWLHMDQVEPEKLEWMKDLPKPSAQSQEGTQARFDFNGLLVARDAEIPVREGLHHHGDEQEIPGYSLEELFTLSRSAVTQQRVLALQTLARVIYNCRQDQLGGKLKEPLIPRLLDAGLLFLFRWSVDDSNEGVMAAAMEGLAGLLIQPGDEDTLDRVFSWHRGVEVTPMLPGSAADSDDNMTDEGEEIQEKDRSDLQIAKQDAVKGLLRMKVLQRLRYILEVVRPPAPVVLNALAILVRICRHSRESAYEVMRCPRLLQTITSEFLPLGGWKHQGGTVTDVYGYPVVLAMKLMQVLCQAGRNLAASLVSGGRLLPAIMRYITVEPADMQLNIAEAYNLSTTSLHVWRTCVSYGVACDEYRELYPLLMQQLTLFQRLSILPLASTEEESDVAVHRLQMTRIAAFLGLLEGVVQVAGTATELWAKLSMRNDKTQAAVSAVQPAPPSINWSHVGGLQMPLEFCALRWLSEMTGLTLTLDPETMDMVSCLLNLLASFYDNYTRQACYRPVECLQSIEKLVDSSLVPFMTSATFYNVMINLKFQSSLRYDEDGVSLYPPSLPDLGCSSQDPDRNYPSVRNDSTCGLAIGLLRLVHTLLKIHRGVASKFCPIVENTYVTSYLERVCKNAKRPSSHLGCCFARFEHQALYYLLKLYQSVVQQDSCRQYSNLYHSVGLNLFVCLQPGDEHYAHDLMSGILFHTDFIAEGRIGDPIAADLADRLKVASSSETPPSGDSLSLTGSAQTGPSRGELLQAAYDHLPSIRNVYMVFFGSGQDTLARSRSKSLHQPHEIDTYMLPEFTGPLLPLDWMFLPLLHLYTEAQKAELHRKSVKALPPHILTALVDALRWIHMLETWRPQSLETIPPAAKIARIFCVFLTGSDLFFEDSVRHYLAPLLRLYGQTNILKLMDFDAPVPGVTSFYDLYMELLTQYEAVSYGDPLFAHFVLLPMQQRFSVGLRKALWCEHADALRVLNLPLSKLILPMENYLHPQESNLELLTIYMKSIVNGAIRQAWSPVMYLVALHHLSGFLFSPTGSDQIDAVKARLRLLRLVPTIKDQVIVEHITRYQGMDLSSPCGFSLYPTIPQHRSVMLEAALRR